MFVLSISSGNCPDAVIFGPAERRKAEEFFEEL
jgi:hypothetical protein